MKQLILTLGIFITLLFPSLPALAITPPSDEEVERIKGAPDLEERIEFAKSVLEPLLNPSADPVGTMETFGNGLERNFGVTQEDEGYLDRYDKNSDTVIDERDFIEMAFDQFLLIREASKSPNHGEARCVVLPIKFPDQDPDPAHDTAYWEDMFFGDTTYTTRSYYIQCSDNSLFISGDIFTNPDETDGWWVAAHERSYYVDEGDLLGEILDYADPYYDFSLYDADSNAEVDGVYFLYAGEDTGWGSYYWGWATYGNYILDGVRVGPLMFCGEFLMTYRVAAHEFGHMMGLPDLYDYNFIDEVAWGIGNWGLMGKGEVYMCPWSRMKLGWAEVIEIAMDRTGMEIYPQSLNSPVYRLWTEGQGGHEYFMVSYGKHEGYDENLPGEGLLIWHIDEYGTNNEWWHKKVDVEEADGSDDLDHFNNPGDETDPYYDPNNTTFDHDSYPNSDNYAGEPTQVEIINISEVGEYMTADFNVGLPPTEPVDETEPNNAWDDSGVKDVIPPNAVIDGRVGWWGDESDFWRYLVTGKGVVAADLISHNPNVNLTLHLWDEYGSGIIASAQTTNPGEHMEVYVDGPGYFFLQVKHEGKAGYYDIRADFQSVPVAGKVDVYGYDIMPQLAYADTLTLPALRISLLNGGGAPATLNELRVYATGFAHYTDMSVGLWLDDGDITFGPGRDELLSGPHPLETDSSSVAFSDLALDIGPQTDLFLTVDLGTAPLFGNEIGLRMFAYKDIDIPDTDVQYHNFPISSKKAFIFNPPMPLCYIAAGDFIMGSDPDNDPYYDPACDLNEETPVHTNRTGDFYISRYEVTNSQYAEFMAAGGYDNPDYWDYGWNWKNFYEITAPNGWNEGEYPIGDDFPDHPVAGVSCYEAMAYAKWAGGRLPHETEWEKAGRGTDGRLYTYGNTYDASKYSSGFPPEPVGSYPESDSLYGVADMHGNVFEWMEDRWVPWLYQEHASGNFDFKPKPGGSYAMQRGYGWLIVGNCGTDYATRLPYRDTWPRRYRWTFVGFRVVFDPP